jgi:hypothetical protein
LYAGKARVPALAARDYVKYAYVIETLSNILTSFKGAVKWQGREAMNRINR